MQEFLYWLKIFCHLESPLPRSTPSLAPSGRGQQAPVPGSGPGPKAGPPERVAGSRASDQVWPPPEMLQRRHCRWYSQVTISAAPGGHRPDTGRVGHRPGRTELRRKGCWACACGGGADASWNQQPRPVLGGELSEREGSDGEVSFSVPGTKFSLSCLPNFFFSAAGRA